MKNINLQGILTYKLYSLDILSNCISNHLQPYCYLINYLSQSVSAEMQLVYHLQLFGHDIKVQVES